MFGKGNDEHLLTAEQAYQLCIGLSDCAHTIETRRCRNWDRIIEWRETGRDISAGVFHR